jgi:hypothetical protein
MNATQQAKFSKIYTESQFKVGDFVHLRTWTVPAEGKQTPVVTKKPMRIMDVYKAYDGQTVFVCGGRKEFSAFSLIPSEWKPK